MSLALFLLVARSRIFRVWPSISNFKNGRACSCRWQTDVRGAAFCAQASRAQAEIPLSANLLLFQFLYCSFFGEDELIIPNLRKRNVLRAVAGTEVPWRETGEERADLRRSATKSTGSVEAKLIARDRTSTGNEPSIGPTTPDPRDFGLNGEPTIDRSIGCALPASARRAARNNIRPLRSYPSSRPPAPLRDAPAIVICRMLNWKLNFVFFTRHAKPATKRPALHDRTTYTARVSRCSALLDRRRVSRRRGGNPLSLSTPRGEPVTRPAVSERRRAAP
jgi:hypothetical protein